MEWESCDYDIAMDKVLHEDKALKTVYLEKWNKLLPKLKHPSVADRKVRGRF